MKLLLQRKRGLTDKKEGTVQRQKTQLFFKPEMRKQKSQEEFKAKTKWGRRTQLFHARIPRPRQFML
jgi:hypothetical protein